MRTSIFFLLALPLVAACVDVDGGAVEVSWMLHTADGRTVSDCACSSPEVRRVRVIVARVGAEGAFGADVCAGRPRCEFDCRRMTGATPFDIPPGHYGISIAPIGTNGEPLTGARVPAPILREVAFGRPVQLQALSIETSCAAACERQNNVCTRD